MEPIFHLYLNGPQPRSRTILAHPKTYSLNSGNATIANYPLSHQTLSCFFVTEAYYQWYSYSVISAGNFVLCTSDLDEDVVL